MTPDWTPERLDEYAQMQGRAQAWARRARMGEFVKDPYETLDMSLAARTYSIFTAFYVAFAFGRSTPAFLMDVMMMTVGEDGGDGEGFSHYDSTQDVTQFTAALQIPGLALALASVGSMMVCAALLAPERNRSVPVWALKGLLGGPVSILELRGLRALITGRDQEEEELQALKRRRNDAASPKQ
jgi:hypothetical protein